MNQTFVVEYCDAQFRAFHKTVSTKSPSKINDGWLQQEIISSLKLDGFQVYAIWEILNGLSFKEHEKLEKADPVKGQQNMRVIYFNRILMDKAN